MHWLLTEHWKRCLHLWRCLEAMLTWCWATCLRWGCLSSGAGHGDLQKSLPTSTFLWVCGEDMYHREHDQICYWGCKFLKFCPKKISGMICYPQFVSMYIWSMRKRNCGLCLHFLSLLSCPYLSYFCNFRSLFFFGERMWFFSFFRCTEMEGGPDTEGSWSLSEAAAINPQSP